MVKLQNAFTINKKTTKTGISLGQSNTIDSVGDSVSTNEEYLKISKFCK